MRTISRDLRTLLGAGTLGALTDGQLLDRFLTRHEEAAFEEIVRRHGPMVWGVCRRTLSGHHDAEDAFQATFLVLARKGDSIRPREQLGNWLHGVAVQTAFKARTMLAKRWRRERQVSVLPEPLPRRTELGTDLAVWLDRELGRLPEKYRVPIVLCDLEGESQKEAAGRLGWPIGTLSGRLSRARSILAKRLDRHADGRSAGAVALLLAREAKSASFPPSLVHSTARAASRFAAGAGVAELVSADAARLTEGVLTAMVLSQVKVLGAGLLMAGLVGLCLGLQVETAEALEGQEPPRGSTRGEVVTPRRVTVAPSSAREDLEFLQGTWFGTVAESGGVSLPTDPKKIPPQVKLIVKGDRVFLRGPKLGKTVSLEAREDSELILKLGSAEGRKSIDLTDAQASNDAGSLTYRGIYSLSSTRIEICLGIPGQDRPKELKTRPRSSQFRLTLARAVMNDHDPVAAPKNSELRLVLPKKQVGPLDVK